MENNQMNQEPNETIEEFMERTIRLSQAFVEQEKKMKQVESELEIVTQMYKQLYQVAYTLQEQVEQEQEKIRQFQEIWAKLQV